MAMATVPNGHAPFGGQVKLRPQRGGGRTLEFGLELGQDRLQRGAGDRQAQVADRDGVRLGFPEGGLLGSHKAVPSWTLPGGQAWASASTPCNSDTSCSG